MTQPHATPKVELLHNLLFVFTEENAKLLIDLCLRTQQRAIERRSEQSVEIIFSENGFSRRFSGSDSVRGIKPQTTPNDV